MFDFANIVPRRVRLLNVLVYRKNATKLCTEYHAWSESLPISLIFFFAGAGQQAQAHLRVAREQVPLAAEGDTDRSRPRQERRVERGGERFQRGVPCVISEPPGPFPSSVVGRKRSVLVFYVCCGDVFRGLVLMCVFLARLPLACKTAPGASTEQHTYDTPVFDVLSQSKALDVDGLYIVHVQCNRAPKQRRRTYRAHGRINRESPLSRLPEQFTCFLSPSHYPSVFRMFFCGYH